MSRTNLSKGGPPAPRLPAMNIAGLYRALDFSYHHPPTVHPVTAGGPRRPAGHSCQPGELERRRRTDQLHRFLGETAPAAASSGPSRAAPAASAAPAPAAAAAASEAGSSCGRQRPAGAGAAPSRLSRLAAAVRESRRRPCVQGADLDQALAAAGHPLQETARRLLEDVKQENQLLQLPAGRRAASSAAPGRSLAAAGRRALLTSAREETDDRERRRRMFSMLYQ